MRIKSYGDNAIREHLLDFVFSGASLLKEEMNTAGRKTGQDVWRIKCTMF